MLAAISYDPIVYLVLGPLRLSPHGLGIAVGFLLGARVMMPAAERKGITGDDVGILLVRAAIGAIIGARIAYVINHFGDYTDDLLGILRIWEGGISLLGGFAGAIIAAIPEMKRRGLSFWQVMDAAAPGMAVGVIVGRIGDLVVADHLGKPTDFALGYRCPENADTAVACVAGPGGIVHQPALYDLVLTIVLLVILLRLRRRERWDGFLICVFGALYGLNRFIEDWFRIDETHGLGLTGSQWTALAAMIVCGSWLAFGRRTPRWGRWNERETAGVAATPSMTTPAPAEGEE
ncbi:MAG TPA: prolipoprotein diacylglyceryl transferase [Acidimicrobiales bacterium]|nr:prolipoprotein diacylglyceryl transferase [Acidimicrobiales bacterium]